MVAEHPPADGKLHPVEELAEQCGVNAHLLAGLRRAKGWAPGKQVTAAELDEALAAYEGRPMGGGRI
jgi:hypothetical protein